ncbi:MAG: hypothetical protein AAGA03_02700 [Planctomycetota bacterium]
MAGESFRTLARGASIAVLLTCGAWTFAPSHQAAAASPKLGAKAKPSAKSQRGTGGGGLFRSADRKQRQQTLDDLPLDKLTEQARNNIWRIAQSPTIYRRLPAQAIDCDRDMFLFLSRNPEILVGLWDLMGITKVQVQRTDQYRLRANDGTGTTCVIDLVYGDGDTHIFVAEGSYDGRLVAKPIRGNGVFVLKSSYAKSASGRTTVTGTIDCFVRFDTLGADLVARTLSGLIGRSADHNFQETARFIGQVSQASEVKPRSMIDVASRMPQVPAEKRQQFSRVIMSVGRRTRTTNSPPQFLSQLSPQKGNWTPRSNVSPATATSAQPTTAEVPRTRLTPVHRSVSVNAR